MKKGIGIAMLVVGVGLFGLAGYFYMQAEQTKKDNDAMQELALAAQGISADKPKEKIWIGADDCKTSFGPNTIAFCDGVSKDSSLFLDSGADAAVQACFEYTAEKLGRPVSEARDIACEVKAAYQERQFEYDSEKDVPGIFNNNYAILNEWVNQ